MGIQSTWFAVIGLIGAVLISFMIYMLYDIVKMWWRRRVENISQMRNNQGAFINSYSHDDSEDDIHTGELELRA